jgi:hypothetical protein
MTSLATVLLLPLAIGSSPPTTPSPPTAVASSSTPAPSAPSTLPPAIVGTWTLDLERSDDPGPLLERLGVPWLFRVLAPKVVQQEIIVESGRVHIRVSGQPRDEILTVDGKTPSHTELVGSPLVLVSRVDGDAIVSEGTITIDGRPLAVRSVRQATTREMRVTNTFGTGPDALVFRRVFVRSPPIMP